MRRENNVWVVPFLAMIALVGAAPAFAITEYVVNGGFETGTMDGWVQWGPIGWGTGTVDVNSNLYHSGLYQLRIRARPNGSLGAKQWVSVPTGQQLDFSCWLRTDNNDVNWAEVLLYNYKVTDDSDIDSGTLSAPYMIWKRDSWGGVAGLPGGYLPTIDSDGSGWEHVTGTVTSNTGWVTIAFKWGDNETLNNTTLRVDDVSLTSPTPPPDGCLRNITRTLAGGLVTVTAAEIDGGSTPGSGATITNLQIKKSSGGTFGPSVTFGCSEVGLPGVILRVTQSDGQTAECSAVVTVLDEDTDSDGTGDCVDSCPTDPNKIDPGVCGCGTPDDDSDTDGTPDCNDGCPTDPNKIDPGVCGCGTPDDDSDTDGTPDCNDGCPTDPNKIDPGVCGCGTPDDDSDTDGTPDCNDGCPTDPNKIDPGVCGCGTPDDDSDTDGTPDCNDSCPTDPNKTDPGVCGCGEVDAGDADSDGVLDCVDVCNGDDASGDSDSDGTCDDLDLCPSDPNKIDPGACGCGVPDPCAAPVLQTVVSRKPHGGAGPLDIDVMAQPESRASEIVPPAGGSTTLTIVATFDMDVALAGDVTVTGATHVSTMATGAEVTVTVSAAFSGKFTLDFANVVDLATGTQASTDTQCVAVQVGDYDGNASTNFNDFIAIKMQNLLFTGATAASAVADFNADGTINFNDFIHVKQANLLFTGTTPCP